MVDFIEEVEENLRSDRYRAIARKTWPWAAALLAAVIVAFLAIWGYQTWRAHNIAKASVAYDKALTELAQGDPTGAYNDFGPIATSGPAGYRTLALMSQGDIRLAAGKSDDAAKLFDQAAKVAPDPTIGDLARLRAALALIDTAPYAQMQTRLTPLIGQGKPYDLQAREALAVAKLAAGKTAEARADFNALTLTIGVSQTMRTRAQAAISLIDAGEAGAVTAAAKAAATMPPPKLESLPGTAPSATQTPSDQGAAAPQPQGEPGSAQ
ncbi:MAG TPA: tetratricopeptide repeat protein [Caulobacteraceae bacterium]